MSPSAVFVCFVLGSLALTGAHVRRDTPDALQQLQKNADEFAKTFGEQINALMNSDSTKKFKEALDDSSKSILQEVSKLSESLQSTLKDADQQTQKALTDTRDKLKAIGDQLRTDHRDVGENAEVLRQKIASAVDATLQQSKDLAKTVAANVEQNNQNLAPKFKEAFDEFVKSAQSVQKSLHDAAEKH